MQIQNNLAPQFSSVSSQANGYKATPAKVNLQSNDSIMFGQGKKPAKAKASIALSLLAALGLGASACGGGYTEDPDNFSKGMSRNVGSCSEGNDGLFLQTTQQTNYDHQGYDIIASDCEGETVFELDTDSHGVARFINPPPRTLNVVTQGSDMTLEVNGETVEIKDGIIHTGSERDALTQTITE